jgi:protein-S-isoprenylcysteine O-methyltransferase Ste14
MQLDPGWSVGHDRATMQTRDETSPAIQLSAVQILRKRLLITAMIALGGCFFVMSSTWPAGEAVHEVIEWVGIGLILACIFGRTWCSYYIAGRKDVALVTVGPYSVCRNPLYVFSILGAFGVGAQFGSIVGALIVGIGAWFLFDRVAAEEEKTLKLVYGHFYDDYCARVSRFMPRLSQWRAAGALEVHRDRVMRTFFDACVFLLAIPAAEALEYLQTAGLSPVLFRIP